MPMILPMHGVGGGADLPLPASLAIAGGSAALVLSFVVLLVAWRRPRFGDGQHEHPVQSPLLSVVESRTWAIGLRAAGLAFFVFMLWPALFGPDLLTNPTFGVVYVWLWVGLVPMSLLFGRFFRAVSPARTLHILFAKATGADPAVGLRDFPARLGYWVASLGLFAFVWLELVYPNGTYLGPVRLWFALYFAAMIIGSSLFGDRWLERADPFEVYSTLVAHLSPWGRNQQGQLVWLSPMRNLAKIVPEPGLLAVVAVLLGSTAFDSWRGSTTWIRFVQNSTISPSALNTAMLTTAIVVVGVVFTIASMLTGTESVPRRLVPRYMAHSLIPIIVGYMVAHYLSYLVQAGQSTLIQISDPVNNGMNLFGTRHWQVNYWLSQHPMFLANTKVLAIVTGHVLGAIAAHDRALEILPKRHQITGQIPLLVAMVLFTYMGLYLLFGA